jgi:hypothetical protein
MTEYVYALHDFLPEHEDEVSFHAGERIEVVEKDDEYGDGWWQVSSSMKLHGAEVEAINSRTTLSHEILSYGLLTFLAGP